MQIDKKKNTYKYGEYRSVVYENKFQKRNSFTLKSL